MCCSRSPSWPRWSSRLKAPCRRWPATPSPTRWRVPHRRSRSAPSPPRRRSKTSATTAVGRSTPTPRIHLKIRMALALMFGRWVGNIKQGIAIAATMGIVLCAAAGIAAWAEQSGNPALTNIGVSQANTSTQAGGNMEGKSVVFGPIYSAQFAATTTGTSTGSVDSSHDSFTPIGGMVPLVLMQLGEVTPGGVGAGLYGMLVFAVLAVFIAGLMVGRTPEYLGKKIESKEVRLASLVILILPASILGWTAISVLVPAGLAGPLNPGAHG